MSLILWNRRNPVSLFDTLSRDFDRMFEDMDSMFSPRSQAMVVAPHYEVEETDAGYLLSVELPGIKKDEIEIEVNGNHLLISAERKEEENGGNGRKAGRRWSRFQRVFQLPETADANHIEARLENGVLELAIAKAENAKPRRISLSTSNESGFFKRLMSKDESAQ